MKSILTNKDNDLYLDASKNLAIGEGLEAAANVSKNAVLVNYGECEFNTTVGVPYFDTIFNDFPLIDLFQAAIIKVLEQLSFVQRTFNFEYKQDGNIFSYSVTEKTDLGDIQING